MAILGWIVLGLFGGSLASKIVDNVKEGPYLDVILGASGALAGAVLGGWSLGF